MYTMKNLIVMLIITKSAYGINRERVINLNKLALDCQKDIKAERQNKNDSNLYIDEIICALIREGRVINNFGAFDMTESYKMIRDIASSEHNQIFIENIWKKCFFEVIGNSDEMSQKHTNPISECIKPTMGLISHFISCTTVAMLQSKS